jgi:lantibiotic transport system permease protein
MLWTLIVLPLYVALTAALVAAVDHQGDNWKHVLGLPVARGSIFAAKSVAAAAVVLLSTLVLATGVCLGAELLRALKPGWRAHTIPAVVVFTRAIQSFSAAAFVLSIQLWVSLRWKSFVAGLALVIVAVMVMLGAVSRASNRAAFVRFYPWAIPVTAIARMMEPARDRLLVATLGMAGGAIAAFAGCRDLARREF